MRRRLRPDAIIVMGRVAAPFGVRGWIRLQTFTDAPQNLLQYREWWLGDEGSWSRSEVEEAAVHGRDVIAKLKGHDDRNAAHRLKGLHVGVPRGILPKSQAGEYYWADLVGLRVKTLKGEELGCVAGLLSTGAHDVLRVEGERERLIPFVEAYVVLVDMDSGELLVDWGVDY